jgi:hypothetical protein
MTNFLFSLKSPPEVCRRVLLLLQCYYSSVLLLVLGQIVPVPLTCSLTTPVFSYLYWDNTFDLFSYYSSVLLRVLGQYL